MKTKLTFWSSMLFLLSLSILLTICLAWIVYPLEIQWLNLTNRVYLKPETIQYPYYLYNIEKLKNHHYCLPMYTGLDTVRLLCKARDERSSKLDL